MQLCFINRDQQPYVPYQITSSRSSCPSHVESWAHSRASHRASTVTPTPQILGSRPFCAVHRRTTSVSLYIWLFCMTPVLMLDRLCDASVASSADMPETHILGWRTWGEISCGNVGAGSIHPRPRASRLGSEIRHGRRSPWRAFVFLRLDSLL